MRLPGLLLGSWVLILALPVACGDDPHSSKPGSAGEAGEAGAGPGSTGDGGSDGTGASSARGGGESTAGGADSGQAGAGDAGAGTGNVAECTPLAQLPKPVSTKLEVKPSCVAPAACGGDVEGTKWAYSAVCLDQQDIFQAVYDECASSQLNGPADMVVSGTLELAGGTATHMATISATGVFQIPNQCHYCDCKGEQEVLKNNGAGPNTFCYEDCYPDLSCRCLIDVDIQIAQEESYQVTDHTLTLDSGAKYDFCESGDNLSLVELGATPKLPGTATLVPFESTVTPEVCDGVDNDKDGEIDNAPQDCPAEPCVQEGVCAGLQPICSGGFWACDYAAVNREMGDETTCDGLDNDCDGEVDEKLVGCFEKCDGLDNDNDGTVDDDPAGSPCSAKLGVCATGASSTCLGEQGWRCDFGSAAYEAGESTCGDNKDNDCDGQVDEGCSCPLGKSQMFVVHWGQTPELIRADLDGKNPQVVAALSGFALTKVVVDSKANKLYFEDASYKIQRSNLDGSNIETLWSGQAQTWDVNPASGLLLGECNTSNICRLNSPNTTTTVVNPATVAGLDIDPVNQTIYWVDYGGTLGHSLLRANLDGSNVTGIIKANYSSLSVEVDPHGQKIYWPNGKGIYEAGLDGSNEHLFFDKPSSYTYDMEVDPVGGKMYFIDFNANEVRRIGLDGKNYEPLIANVTYPISISLYICP